ncbi:MAG: 2-oxoglutarate translocator [Peptostreptococcaceae bacterium]
MRRNSKVLLGLFSISIGISTILSLLLPNWMWTLVVAGTLIGCGVFSIYN